MTEAECRELEERVLLLAPTARDAELSHGALAAAGVRCVVCPSLEEACRELGRGAGAAVVPAEAILNDRAGRLAEVLRAQPAWSDYPLLVLTAAGAEVPEAYRALESVGHMTLMKRPVQVSTLVSAVRAALRDRRRQYEVRDHLAQRERQAEALRRAEERLRLILESARDYAIFALDLGGKVVSWNAGAERVFGWAEADILGRDAAVLFTPEDRAAGVPELEMGKAREAGRAEDERWHVRKDGSRFFASGVLTLIRDGELRGYTKVARDITARKLAEEAMARDALLLAGVRDSVIVTDLDGVVTYGNEGATRLFGWTAQEMIGRPVTARIPEAERAKTSALIRALAGGEEFAGEWHDYRKDGTRVWIDARVSRFTDAAGRPVGILGLAHDISDRKRAEEALREADRRKDEFLAMLGHELRNPLAPVRSALEVLRLRKVQDPKVERAHATIDRQVTHLTRLVDDLLDVSRITRGLIELHREPVDLATVVSHAVEMVAGAVQARGHELMVSLPTRPVRLEADATRLTQVVFNLLNNAAKYTEPGGRIWLTAEREGSEVVVRVRDTGVGIAPELLPRVFDLFTQGERTLDRSQGGLGLGLTLVRSLVEMHGGRVEAHSAGPGKGSEFVARLPALPAAAAESPRAPAPQPPAARPVRVMVVDDNVDVAEAVAMLLEDLGHVVQIAHSGPQALELARDFRPEAVFLDIGLPGMDGYEVAQRLRAEPGLEGMLLAALSGYGQEEDHGRSRESGFDEHLVKPVGSEELQALLARVGAGGPGEAAGPRGR
jgi:PAS domain S-box-containing protein